MFVPRVLLSTDGSTDRSFACGLGLTTRTLLAACGVLLGLGAATTAVAARPSFFSLGGDVYRADERLEAEAKLLRLSGEPRWFAGFPKEVTREVYEAWERQQAAVSRQEESVGPRAYQIPTVPTYPPTLDALATRDQGATLGMTAKADEKDPAGAVVVELTLTAGDRAIRREVEHRRTNVLPFLFAFKADGQPVSREGQGGVAEGGVKRFVELVPANSRKSWTLRVAQNSLASVLPADARETAIVAVFSERQHSFYSAEEPALPGEIWDRDALRANPPQIVVRSNEVRLRKQGDVWMVPAP